MAGREAFARLRRAWRELTAPGAAYAWSEIEIDGLRMRAFDRAPASMRDVWLSAAARAEAPYVGYAEERYSYGEFDLQVRALARALSEDHGVRPGDRVALALRNYPEWIAGYWAALSLGAIAVGLNAWWTGPELEFGLADSGARVLICDDERLERIVPRLDDLRRRAPLDVIAVRQRQKLPPGGRAYAEAIGDPARAPGLLDVGIRPDDPACVFYTSGTTGRPKGAVLTHRGCVTNILHMAFWSELVRRAGGSAPPAGMTPRFLLGVPLFHVTGCNCALHPATYNGGRIVLMRKWDPAHALELIERERITNFTGVPAMMGELLQSPDFERRDTSSLVVLGGGGSPQPPELVREIERRLPGGQPRTGYGLTETTGVVALNSAEFYRARPESVGPALPTVQVRIVDEGGRELPGGEVGELWVRGPNVIRNYLNHPENSEEIAGEGWFRTGDLVRGDEDGFLTVVDRAKDMLLRGGENVYCAEVEAAIYEHPDVGECAVFGVPDPRLGEEPAAAVVPRAGRNLDADEIRRHVADRLASYKVPARIWLLREPLPRNANGKYLKRELRARLLDADPGRPA